MQGFEREDLHGRNPIQAGVEAIEHDKSGDILTMSEGEAEKEGQEGDIAKDTDTKSKRDGLDLVLLAGAVCADAFKYSVGA